MAECPDCGINDNKQDEFTSETLFARHNRQRRLKGGYTKVDWRILQSGQLTATELALYCLLCSHINQTTGRLDPSIRTLTKELHTSPNTTQKALQALQTKNIITIHKRPKTSNFYTINDLQNRPSVSPTDTPAVSPSDTKLDPIITSTNKRRRSRRTCHKLHCPNRQA